MIWNAAFEPARMVYAPGYENALHFSPRFQAFAEDLAQGLVELFDLQSKHVFEIGCGDGHMLDLMVKHGAATATGFDPSMAGIDSPFTARDGVDIVPEYFRSDQLDRPFDAILCRHVLEHLDTPMPLLQDIRRAIGDRDVPVYFEVPNAGWMLRAVSMWDVIYEHVGYWTAPAMETAFRRAGLAPVSVREGYDGQFLMLEARPTDPDPEYVAAGVDGVPLFSGAMVSRADGRNAIEAISIQTASGVERVAVDCLAVTGGWNPTVHLTCHMNGRPTWNENLASFVPTPGSIPGLVAAGACNGDMSTAACLAAGVKAVESACDLTAKIDVPDAEDDPYRIAPLWAVPGKGRAWLDFQNDVSVKDIKQAASENFRSVEHMKRYTTQGMATDQGKNSNVQALALLADATGRGIPETGTTTFRPPYMPVPIAALGAGGQNVGFAPERKTTSHTVSENMGAPMIAAGLWWRPSYFPKSGEKTWRESCDREVGYIRNSVGICDVSTLGKIDIQGPDAATLLDFVYTNMFSSLKEGRVRYGLMLREDGFVMDDGTTARLGQDHYVMTTTTAAAGQVMRHLDFATQALNPHWDVQYISVTEQWAQFAVAGPKSRDVLNAVLDAPIDNDSFPFMACGAVSVGGIDARLFRISFSGEHAYEIAVPARYGESLFETLVQEAQKLGGGAYGMEALNVARIEKGFITHSEITGRVTAYDIGMERMVSAKKDCIGKTMSQRAGLTEPDRERMVGLKAVGVVKQMTGGAHLYNEDADAHRVHMQGYITSVGWSPSLDRSVALGFVKGGMTREGDVLKMVDAMRGVETLVEVVAPDQIDPDGGRVRG